MPAFRGKESGPEAYSDRRERALRHQVWKTVLDSAQGKAIFAGVACLPSPQKQRKSRRRWRRFLESLRRPRCPNPSPPARPQPSPGPHPACPAQAPAEPALPGNSRRPGSQRRPLSQGPRDPGCDASAHSSSSWFWEPPDPKPRCGLPGLPHGGEVPGPMVQTF